MDRAKELKMLIEMSNVLGQTPDESMIQELQSIEEATKKSTQVDLITKSAQQIKKSEQSPKPSLTFDPTKGIETRIKFLESTVARIGALGPGSGEVNFRFLDDVNRATIGSEHTHLKYNPVAKKFYFGYLTGDHGEVNSLTFAESGKGVESAPRQLAWNESKDCLDVTQEDGTTCQLGLETYVRVFNNTANTLVEGTFVQFSGVTPDSETPTCIPFDSGPNSIPIYSIGILTTEATANGFGRATTIGEVRELDTTGTDVGEIWQVGDILWANPATPGKLTRVQPTAPNVVVSVATVLKANVDSGILLVRPVVFPRLYYGVFSDTSEQTAAAPNTAYPIRFNTTQIGSGVRVASNTRIYCDHSGLYNFQFSLQVVSSSANTQNVWIWPRIDGVDVPSSTGKVSLDSNKSVLVPAWNYVLTLLAGQYFELMWATDSTSVKIDAPPATAFAPATPSAILSVAQENL